MQRIFASYDNPSALYRLRGWANWRKLRGAFFRDSLNGEEKKGRAICERMLVKYLEREETGVQVFRPPAKCGHRGFSAERRRSFSLRLRIL